MSPSLLFVQPITNLVWNRAPGRRSSAGSETFYLFQSNRQNRGHLKYFGYVYFDTTNRSKDQDNYHPRRPRGGHLGREKRRDESFQAQAEKPLGTDSHRTISKRSSECWLLIGHKRCFVLLCPISKQFLVSSFREFVYDGYFLAAVAPFVHQASLTRNEESTEESINVSDAISRSNSICTEKILFLTDHNVS